VSVKARSAPRRATFDRRVYQLLVRVQPLFTRLTGRRFPSPARLRQLAGYAAVSAISTSVTLSLLGVLIYTKALSPGWANLVATGVGTVPSFELNRRWVWAKRTRRSIFKEVVPFCALSFSGLGLSTLMVSVAAGWSSAAGLGSGATALISQATNLATFGALWVVQFFLLDRVLFAAGREVAGGQPGGAQTETGRTRSGRTRSGRTRSARTRSARTRSARTRRAMSGGARPGGEPPAGPRSTIGPLETGPAEVAPSEVAPSEVAPSEVATPSPARASEAEKAA
jgi:putative flippase GtrA